MSIVVDVFIWLLIESFFGFVFYVTGCFILKVFTFGQYKFGLKDYTVFKASKNKRISAVWFLGLSFYIALFVLIVYLSNI